MNLKTLLVEKDPVVLSEAFVRSLSEIARQGERAAVSPREEYDSTLLADINCSCVYETTKDNGKVLRCAVGWLMDEAELARFKKKSPSILVVVGELDIIPESNAYGVLALLQQLHDRQRAKGDDFRECLIDGLRRDRSRYAEVGITDETFAKGINAINSFMGEPL